MTKTNSQRAVRIIFVNRYFFPDHSATSQMLSELAFAMSARGHLIGIVTSRQLYEDAKANLSPHETAAGVEIWRAWSTAFGRAGIVGRACDYVSFYFGAFWLLLRHIGADDIVVVKTDPPLLSVIIAPLVHWRRAQLVNWLQDVFPEVAQAVYGGGGVLRPAYSALAWLRTRTLKQAAVNVVLGRRMRAHIEALGVAADGIVEIPNWADGALLHPIAPADNPLRAEWGLETFFTVVYSGNLGRAHDYQTFLQAAAILKATAGYASRPVRWLFIGGGALIKDFQRAVAAAGVRSVIFKPYQPREKLAESLACADIHLVSLRPELEGLIVPSKYYGIAAVGRPCVFIGAADGELAMLLQQTHSGVTIVPGDGRALADAVASLSRSSERCEMMGRNARAAFEQAYDSSHAFAAWERLLTGLMKRRRERIAA